MDGGDALLYGETVVKETQDNKKKINRLWFWLGLAVVLASALPYLLLGENAIFTYHDQLDGELIAYLLQARHLFQGDVLPEFMGGMPKTALTMPAPLGVLLFLGGDGCIGLTIMMITGRFVGYLGMYLLCRETVRESWIAALFGGLYAFLPFLPVYGLSQYGIPLLFWCFLQLKNRRHLLGAFFYTALYTMCSSLVLVGFGLLGMGAIFLIGRLLRKCSGSLLLPFAAWTLMLVLYVAENFRLFRQLADGGELSHKAEYILQSVPFFGTFASGVLSGGEHSQDLHVWILAAALTVAAVWLVRGRMKKKFLRGTEEIRLLRIMAFCLCCNCFFAFVSALWQSKPGMALRGQMSVFGAFQLDRLLWIAPCFWYLLGACGAALVWRWLLQPSLRPVGVALALSEILAICFTGIQLLLGSDVKSNIQKLLHPDYSEFSFCDYYAIGVMEQVELFLHQQTGLTQEEYWVVSLGIDPAAALYHGFYCLDGYSNNYPAAYKHAFRNILVPELEKSDYLREYFDDWGNRCYLFSSEIPGYYTVGKTGFWFQNYELDTEALRDMGGKFLLSAAYIMNAQDQGLRLLREEPFETQESYYRIFVYEVQ